jgi:hypothetical protein
MTTEASRNLYTEKGKTAEFFVVDPFSGVVIFLNTALRRNKNFTNFFYCSAEKFYWPNRLVLRQTKCTKKDTENVLNHSRDGVHWTEQTIYPDDGAIDTNFDPTFVTIRQYV